MTTNESDVGLDEILEKLGAPQRSNLVGKLIGGAVLYGVGKIFGGDYGAIVGAYMGLRANYYFPTENNETVLEITFKEKRTEVPHDNEQHS